MTHSTHREGFPYDLTPKAHCWVPWLFGNLPRDSSLTDSEPVKLRPGSGAKLPPPVILHNMNKYQEITSLSDNSGITHA